MISNGKGNNKAERYKLMKKLVLAISAIFFIVSISVKVNSTLKLMKKSSIIKEKAQVNSNYNKEMDIEIYNAKFHKVYEKIYDGMIQVNESLSAYASKLDKTKDKNLKAYDVLKYENKKLIDSNKFIEINDCKSYIDTLMREMQNMAYKNEYEYPLLVDFYKNYCEYYNSLINIEGNCNEYLERLRKIENNAIKIGDEINNLK